MNLQEALAQYSSVRAFRVGDHGSDDYPAWDVRPVDTAILSERDGYFIVKAKNILPDGRIRDCYIDLPLPERISDYAYLVWCGSLDVRYHHEFGGEIICAVPIDCFGQYDLFYSRIAPDIGIEILREGLAISARKKCIAQDLGYILRDEGRFREAAEAFQCAVDEGPSSYFIFGELADCYDRIGNKEMARKYEEMFRKARPSMGWRLP